MGLGRAKGASGSVVGDSGLLERGVQAAIANNTPALAEFLTRARDSLKHMNREGKPVNASRHYAVFFAHLLAIEVLESKASVVWEVCANCGEPIYQRGFTWLHQNDLPVCYGAVVYRARPLSTEEGESGGPIVGTRVGSGAQPATSH